MKFIATDIASVMYAYGAFLLAYLANILFSVYLNVELLNHSFDKYKLGQSVKKAVVLIVATLMLVLAIDVIVAYFGAYIPELNEELQNLVTVAAIIVTIGRVALGYLVEAYNTFKNILEAKPSVEITEGQDNG